jgi:3-oxoacyl-[acyl-carrier-protein] synthase II
MVNLKTKGSRYVSPQLIPSFITNMASGVIGIDLKVKGVNFSITSACASSTHAIGEAFNKIKHGEVDMVFAGGSEASITELGFAGFCSMKAMASKFNENPTTASRPFNINRGGFVMGEGSVILVLENLKGALKRNAGVYCEILEYKANCDSFHITTPDPSYESLKVCYKESIKRCGSSILNIDYINLHGTSTSYNDSTESGCLRSLISSESPIPKKFNFFTQPTFNSTKSMTGHLLGSAGALETAVCVLSTLNNIIPPTINYCLPDEKCNLFYNPNRLTVRAVNKSLNVNLGFGGHNSILVFKKFVH